MPTHSYRFGPFRLLPAQRRLLRDGTPVPLTDREFDTLYAIARRLAEPVSTQTLLDEIWHGLNVERQNIARQVATLNRKLGNDDTAEHYIRHVAKKGYYIAGISMRPSTARLRRLIMIGVPVCLLGLLAIYYRPGHPDFRIVGYRQLTRDGKVKVGPLVTDGQRIYFTETLARPGPGFVGSVSVNGGDVAAVEMPVASPSVLDISRDRTSLLVTSGDRGRLLEWNLRSGKLRELTVPAVTSGITHASWHPSGRRFAATVQDELLIVDPQVPSQAHRFRLPGPLGRPHWNSKGDRLRFDVVDSKAGTSSWWEMDGDHEFLYASKALAGLPRELNGSWTRNDAFYLFQNVQTDDLGQSDLWVSRNAGNQSRTRRLTNGPLSWHSPTASITGQTIFAIGIQGRGELVRLGSWASNSKPLLGGLPGYEVDFSRDAEWAVFTRFPEHTIWRAKSDGSEPKQLSPNDMEAHQPHWSPDGTRLAFMGKNGSRSPWRVYIVAATGGSLEMAQPEGDHQGVPTWSPDGRFLYFGARSEIRQGERAVIQQLDLRTRKSSEIRGPVGLWSPRMSPDGRFLAAVSYDSRTLFVRDNSTKAWRKLAEMKFIEEPSWLPDSSKIQFYARVRDDCAALFRVGPTGGHLGQVADLIRFERVGAAWYGVAPDGSPLGFRGATTHEIYALDWE